MEIKIKFDEKKALSDALKLSNNKRIFANLLEINKLGLGDKDLNKAKSKSNYVDMTEICDRRKDIKCDVVKKQISNLTLLELLSMIKPDKNNLYNVKIEGVLIMTLIDSITLRILKLEKDNKDNENNKNNEEIEILRNLLIKIEKEIDIMELYKIKKEIEKEVDIMEYKEICIKLIGGKRKNG